jgi:phage terminase large subunit GpA-like protein
MSKSFPLPAGCTVEDWNRSIDDLLEFLPSLWPGLPTLTPSEYAEKFRIMPKPFAGPWSNERTPYLREIMDDMGPASPIQEEYCLKGHQIGFTAASENILLYWMDYNPTYLLYVSSTDDALKKWMSERLEPAIDSIPGLRNKFIAPMRITKGGSRQTGDTTTSKQYIGGALDTASAQSPASLASQTKQLVIFDEIDRVPELLKTGEGSFLDVGKARTDSFGKRRKILGFSTPTTYEASLIWKKYQAGDQRKYLVPCPHCGRPQELVMMTGGMKHGLTADFKAGEFQHAYYLCEFCYDPIYNYHKARMLEAGHWEPTARSCYPEYRSRHISTLYAPPGMTDWDGLYRKYLAAQETPEGMATFTQIELGLPSKDTAARPSREAVLAHRGAYAAGSIPAGVLYLVASVDVQQGSAKDPANPERLELQVMGTGAGYRTWSIIHKKFIGDTSDAFSGAWEELNQFAEAGGLQFHRPDGRAIGVKLIFIDSGDSAFGRSEPVYRFCQRWKNTFPIKGFSQLVADPKKREKGDIAGASGFKKYRAAAIGMGGETVYEISTHFYKNIITTRLNIPRRAEDPQQPGFMDFPRKCDDYDDEWYEQLNGTEKNALDGSFHDIRKRVEALDLTVYCYCAADVWLDLEVERIRRAYQSQGCTRAQVEAITVKTILDKLALLAVNGK